MKKSILILIVALFVLVVGCTENTVVNPTPVESLSKRMSNDRISNTISINRMLGNPYPVFNSYYRLSGQLQYEITQLNSVNNQDQKEQHLLLHLCITADLTEFCTVSNQGNEIFAGSVFCDHYNDIIVSGTYVLVKSYTVNGREDGMKLVCNYNVTDKLVEVDAIWLELPTTSQSLVNQTY